MSELGDLNAEAVEACTTLTARILRLVDGHAAVVARAALEACFRNVRDFEREHGPFTRIDAEHVGD